MIISISIENHRDSIEAHRKMDENISNATRGRETFDIMVKLMVLSV